MMRIKLTLYWMIRRIVERKRFKQKLIKFKKSSTSWIGLKNFYLSLPQPGLPRPVEYFNINGMNARSWACVIFSTGVGIPSTTNGGNSCNDGSSFRAGGVCNINADSSSCVNRFLQFLSTSSNGLAPNTLKLFCVLPGVIIKTTACWPTRTVYSSIVALNFLINLVCWRLRIDGFVSNECGLLRFLTDTIAAAAATPVGPIEIKW